jgi:hypothetical protein
MLPSNEELPLSAAVERSIVRYKREVLASDLPSTDRSFQQAVSQLIDDFRTLWTRFQKSDKLSKNDEKLDDLTLGTLRCLTLPYFLGDLYQRLVTLTDASEASEDSERARSKVLAVSEHFFKEFLSLMVDLGVANEREVETQTTYSGNTRTSRVARSREKAELHQKLSETDSGLAYETAKRRRLRELMAEDGDDKEEAGGCDEELFRARETLYLRWCTLDAMAQLDVSSREMDMIGRLDEAQKRLIVQNYQAGIQHFRERKNDTGRHSYTILPGGLITPGILPPNGQQMQTFREQVRAEVFLERNRPTMTLEEFAQQEMAEIQRQMDAQAAGEAAQKAEDDRLGTDGIEERERVKQSQWDDWRDANPPIGITTKGNYS